MNGQVLSLRPYPQPQSPWLSPGTEGKVRTKPVAWETPLSQEDSEEAALTGTKVPTQFCKVGTGTTTP